jgi:hypothetical protein
MATFVEDGDKRGPTSKEKKYVPATKQGSREESIDERSTGALARCEAKWSQPRYLEVESVNLRVRDSKALVVNGLPNL